MILRLAPFAPFLAATAIRAIAAIPCGETARTDGVGGSGGSGAVSAGVSVSVTTGGEGGNRFDSSAANDREHVEQPPALLMQP